MRAEADVVPSKMCHIQISVTREDLKKCIEDHREYFEKLGHVEQITFLAPGADKPENALTAVVTGMEVYLELKGLIDTEKEKDVSKKQRLLLKKTLPVLPVN